MTNDPRFDPQAPPGEDAAGEARLRALFGAELSPPARDPAFVHAAMHAIGVRRFWFDLLAAVPWLVAASAALWAFGPLLSDLWREASRSWADSPALTHGLAHASVLLAPTAAVLLGLAFMAAPSARRL